MFSWLTPNRHSHPFTSLNHSKQVITKNEMIMKSIETTNVFYIFRIQRNHERREATGEKVSEETRVQPRQSWYGKRH